MSQAIAHVEKYMTRSPHSIGQAQTLAHAHDLMREHRIRHLPVLHGGKLVGLLSDRDLHLIETLRDVDPARLLVEDAMTTPVYSVSPKAMLDEVVREMAKHKYGCAVVEDNGKVVGVFPPVDALAAFADLLDTRLRG